jgi:hypothetical protein
VYSERVPHDFAYLIGLDVNVLQIHVYIAAKLINGTTDTA